MDIKTYAFKHDSEGKHLLCDVYYRVTKSTQPPPIALMIHGGGFTIGSKEHIPLIQISTLVELGFVVVSPNYRLCPTISLYDGPYADCKDCLSWCRSTLPSVLSSELSITIDPARIVVMGHSAGGHLSMLLTTVYPPPIAVLAMYGPSHLCDSFWHTATPNVPPPPSNSSSDLENKSIDAIFQETPPPHATAASFGPVAPGSLSLSGADTSNLPSSSARWHWMFHAAMHGELIKNVVKDGNYDRVDPACHLSNSWPPTFLVHGTADVVVPARFTQQIYEKLRQLGPQAALELRLVEGAGHAFDEPLKPGEDGWEVVEEALNWLAVQAGLILSS